MGLFGNKNKKFKEINNMNKATIISLIEQIKSSTADKDIQKELLEIGNMIQSHQPSVQKELVAIDAKTIHLLKEAAVLVDKKQYIMVASKIANVRTQIANRKQYCLGDRRLSKKELKILKAAEEAMNQSGGLEETRTDELQSQVEQYSTELSDLMDRLRTLQELYKKEPTNTSIRTDATIVSNKIAALNKKIESLGVHINTEAQVAAAKEADEFMKELNENASYTQEEIQVTAASLQANSEKLKEQEQQNQELASVLGASLGVGATDPFAALNGQTSTASDPFAVLGNNTTSTQTGSNTQTQFGSFDSSAIGTSSMANDIKREKRGIEEALSKYDDMLEDASEDLEDLNRELIPLLQKRQNASPSDCLVLDGQIDKINARRGGLINKIKRLRQAEAQLNDKLSLLDKLETQQDLAATNAQIEKLTGGKFADFAGLAMFLNEAVKESNEQLEEIGMAVNISESEEIQMNSATGASAVLSDAGATVKDEDKYAALEQELGLALRA